MRNVASLFFIISAVSLFLGPFPVQADSAYTPPGLYNVEDIKLGNGFRVLLKPRSQAHNVAIRLAIHLGTRHFDCNRSETPHVLEHLLFSGTSKHSESELDRMIEDHGGSWNAVTGQEYTTYEVNIFDQYTDVALGTLFEIMTDTEFTQEKLDHGRDIVARELGGRPSYLRQLLYQYNIGKTAWQKAEEWLLPGDTAACGSLANMEDITEGAIRDAYSFYTAQNMTLVVVGSFDRDAVLAQVRKTFGAMAPSAGSAVPRIMPAPYPAGGPVQVQGLFAPLLGSSGHVGAAFRTAGSDSADTPALQVLTEYLNKLLYEQVRVKNALSYNPEVSSYLRPDSGILYLSADTGLKKSDHVLEVIDRTLNSVVKKPPSPEEVEQTKQKMLLKWMQSYETNRGLADFYADAVHELNRTGRFRNYEQDIERVTAEDVSRVISTTLRDDRKVKIYGVPTLSYTYFYALIGSGVCIVLFFMILFLRRAVSGRKKAWYRR